MKKTARVGTSLKKVPLNIKYTNANTKLSLLAGINRPIKPQQVTKLAESVNAMGIIRPVVISEFSFINGKKEKYIIDGQHLSMSLMRNNMTIPYVEISISNKQELIECIALLNSSSKSWTMQDYVVAWSNINPDFIKLNEYFTKYDFELNILASILSNCEIGSTGTASIKKGTFKIKNENQGKLALDYLTDLFKVISRGNRYETRYMCSEFWKFYRNAKNYNHAKFISNVKKNKAKLELISLETGKLAKVFQTYC